MRMITLFLMAIVLSFSCITQAVQIAEWRLDGDLTDSLGSYDAVRVNAPSYTAGIDGQALDYIGGVTPNPDNVIEVPYNASLNTADFTVSAWVKITGSAGTYRTVVSQRDQYLPASGYIIYANSSNHWEAWVGVDNGGWFLINGPPITYDKWTQVALSYNSTTKQAVFSVNGTAYSGDLSAYTYVPNASRGFRIGCGENEAAAGAFYMDGLIDHIQLWNHAHTAAELAQMYDDMTLFPIAEWRLDGDLTDSVGSYDAARVNAPSYTGGVDGQALDYAGGVTPDSDNVIEVPYDVSLNTADFTVSAWVKVTGGAGNYRAVVSQRGQYSPASGYVIYATPTDQWQAWIGVNGGGWFTINGPVIAYDKWTHVALSYNSTTKQAVFSINGATYSGDLSAFTYVPNTNTSRGFRIGCGENENPSGAFYMDGVIDHIQLWDKALAATELAQMYAEMAPSRVKISEWRFDGDLTDSVGTYDAARVNAPSYTAGIDGQALDYTGSVTPHVDNVTEVPYNASLNTADFTVSAWVKVTGGAGTYRTVVSKRDQYTPASGYMIYANSSDNWEAWVGVDNGGWWIINGPPITYDKWTQVALSYNNSTKSYIFSVSGSFYNGTTGDYTYIPNSFRGLRIGCGENEVAAGSFYMDGLIDHVQLWDYALDELEIGQVYADITGRTVCVPEDGAVDVLGVNPLLEWNSQPGATGYNIYFSANQDSVAFRSDLDGSRHVDLQDLAMIAEHWQMNGMESIDLDSSGVVDLGDIQILAADWLSDSSAFKGAVGPETTTYAAGPLDSDTPYYWRIDALEGGTVYKGDVWEFTTYNADGLAAALYDNKDFTQQQVTRIDAQVAFDWGTAAPDPAMGADTFSIAWEGGIQVPEQGQYTFYTSSDDGVRLYVNDILIIDHWYDQGLTEHTGQIKLRPGTVYPVRLDYYESGGPAAVSLSWSGPGISKQIIPQSYLTSSPTTTPPDDIWVVDVWQQTMTERLLTLTLQGLVSKDIPSIWVVHGGLDSYMRQDLEQDGTVFHDNASVWVLLDLYRDFVEGIIVCDSDLSSINAATSLCGPMNAIAVDESLLTRVQSQTGLPVLVDVRGYYPSTIYNNYQNLFSHEFVVDVAVTDYLRDLSVRYNAFTFYNVTSTQRRQYVGGLTSQGAAFGWGNNAEYYWVDDLARVNASGVPADYCKNLSALSKIRTNIPSPPMKYPEPAQEGQRIVAFVMSDGDNLQVMEWTFVNDSRYFGSPYRGTFSMSWEFPPYMAELAPLGVKQYYDLGSKGTNVDCFITGPSGAGYAFPNLMPDSQPFAQTTGRLMEKCRLKVATILNGNGGSMSDSDELLDRPEVMGVVYKDYYDYKARNGAVYWRNGKPCASYKYLLWEGTGDWNSVSSAIASMPSSPTTNQNSYALVNAHAWSFDSVGGPMEAIKRTVDLLPPNTRVVTVDEFIILLRNNFGDPVTEQEYNQM